MSEAEKEQLIFWDDFLIYAVVLEENERIIEDVFNRKNLRYRDLKANSNFIQLQNELTETENKIALSRQFYNDIVLKYNNAIEMFPASLIAGLCGFCASSFWEVKETERETISIKAEDMRF